MTSISTLEQPVKLNNQYGTEADFANAVLELQASLSSESVSTDTGIITTHSKFVDGVSSKVHLAS